MIIEEITMSEFQEKLKESRTIIFPFGTIEEHGSHLPLNTDTLIIQRALLEAEKKRRFFLAPPVYYGVCTTTSPHPGTIGITPPTLRRLTYDLVVDSYKKGLRNFLLLSGHGGGMHMSAMKESAERLVDELDDIRIVTSSPYELIWKELSEITETENDSHAGELETSLVLALEPELVKGRAEEEYPSLPRPFIVKDKIKYWPGGVWGNPQKATKEKGEKALQIIVDWIIDLVDRIEDDSSF